MTKVPFVQVFTLGFILSSVIQIQSTLSEKMPLSRIPTIDDQLANVAMLVKQAFGPDGVTQEIEEMSYYLENSYQDVPKNTMINGLQCEINFLESRPVECSYMLYATLLNNLRIYQKKFERKTKRNSRSLDNALIDTVLLVKQAVAPGKIYPEIEQMTSYFDNPGQDVPLEVMLNGLEQEIKLLEQNPSEASHTLYHIILEKVKAGKKNMEETSDNMKDPMDSNITRRQRNGCCRRTTRIIIRCIRGPRGKRGCRGKRGNTGATGPCCTGATGATGATGVVNPCFSCTDESCPVCPGCVFCATGYGLLGMEANRNMPKHKHAPNNFIGGMFEFKDDASVTAPQNANYTVKPVGTAENPEFMVEFAMPFSCPIAAVASATKGTPKVRNITEKSFVITDNVTDDTVTFVVFPLS